MRRSSIRAGWAASWATVILVAQTAWAGSVRTRDGTTHSGKLEFRAGNQVGVTPASGTALTVRLPELARITMTDPAPAAKPVERDSRLPSPWQQADIGRVKAPGSGQETDGVFTLRGAGWGTWGAADSCHFVFQPCSGDVDLLVRLGTLPTEEDAFVAGLAIREGLEASAAQASVMMFPGGVVRMGCRPVGGAVEAAPPAGDRPYQWLRLARTGEHFSGFCSRDGQTWLLVGTVRVRMSPAANVGVACATTLNHAVLGTTFDHVKLTPQTMGPPAGFGLVDGSVVAARVQRLDEQWLQYVDAAGTERKLPAEAIACLFTRPLPADVRRALAERKPGLSLLSGDEIEGAVESLRDGQITVASVLFGRQSTPLSSVLTAALRRPHATGACSVSARDGSVYRCAKVTVGEAGVTAESGVLGTVNLKPEEIREIEFSEDR